LSHTAAILSGTYAVKTVQELLECARVIDVMSRSYGFFFLLLTPQVSLAR